MAKRKSGDVAKVAGKKPAQARTSADAPNAVDFPIVGIGASAGGLAAFEAFFSGMPPATDPGMAFVLVQHLAPDHKSILTELVQRYTRMEVFEVEDGTPVRPNCAYIIPPNRDMAFLNGTLQLMEPSAPRGQRLPINFFFRTLAQDQHERAICIVLSGTGSDGSLGLRAIKGEGGMAMVQNPASTEFDGMPRSAIATGLVDYVLPPAEMPAQLIAYASRAFGIHHLPDSPTPHDADNTLKKIFVLLRAQTGHDFSQYKVSTISRRIERRMAVQQIGNLAEYLKFIQQAPVEVEALFRDLLISVTSFFRDPECFTALKDHILPELFAGKRSGDTIRVWSAGCATGEEAYSLALLLAEQQEATEKKYKLQVFATDIDSNAIEVARAGAYPASIAADVSPQRLARYFKAEPGGAAFRINKRIRDMLIFSEQDVIKDPPFSRLDLISCRNLLIYMGGDLQKKIIPLFHYALNPGGILLLGNSETVGDFSRLFVAVDRKLKLYRRREYPAGEPRSEIRTFEPPFAKPETAPPLVAQKEARRGTMSLQEITEKALLKHLVPSAALVNARGDILYLHGRTGLYLEPAPGEVGVSNILKMAREGLRRDLTAALRKAAAGMEVVRCRDLQVKSDLDLVPVDLTVCRAVPRIHTAEETSTAGKPEEHLYLVILEPARPLPPPPAPSAAASPNGKDGSGPRASKDGISGADARIAKLLEELRAKDESLQTTFEELETANEELKSSNEEMQSVNEELQSTNEELETSKEELQSVNEELTTVNAELQGKVSDLSQMNNDMNNLLAGTGVGTLFVDLNLRIARFTPATTRVINLIQSDIGRPIGHIVSNLTGYDDMVADTQEVLRTLIPKEVAVRTNTGLWYSMRILPYRTLDNVIEGAVITFIDITDIKKLESALRETQTGLSEAIVATVREPLLVLDADFRVISANRAFYRLFKTQADQTLGLSLFELSDRRWEIPELGKLLKEILPRNESFSDFRMSFDIEDGGRRTLSINGRRIFNETGQSELILFAIEDISDRGNAMP